MEITNGNLEVSEFSRHKVHEFRWILTLTLPILVLVKLLKYLNCNKLEPTDTYPLLSHTTVTHLPRVLRDIINGPTYNNFHLKLGTTPPHTLLRGIRIYMFISRLTFKKWTSCVGYLYKKNTKSTHNHSQIHVYLVHMYLLFISRYQLDGQENCELWLRKYIFEVS